MLVIDQDAWLIVHTNVLKFHFDIKLKIIIPWINFGNKFTFIVTSDPTEDENASSWTRYNWVPFNPKHQNNHQSIFRVQENRNQIWIVLVFLRWNIEDEKLSVACFTWGHYLSNGLQYGAQTHTSFTCATSPNHLVWAQLFVL